MQLFTAFYVFAEKSPKTDKIQANFAYRQIKKCCNKIGLPRVLKPAKLGKNNNLVNPLILNILHYFSAFLLIFGFNHRSYCLAISYKNNIFF